MKTLLSILSVVVFVGILTFLVNPENQIPYLTAVCRGLAGMVICLLLFAGFHRFYELIFKDNL